jgi:hypothetical protein
LQVKLFNTLFSIYINNFVGPQISGETSDEERDRMADRYFEADDNEQDAVSHASHNSNRSQSSEFSPVHNRSLARVAMHSSRSRKRIREEDQEPALMNLLARTAVNTGVCNNIYINKKKPSKTAHPTKQAARRGPRKTSLFKKIRRATWQHPKKQ